MNSCNTDIFFSNYYHLQSVRFEYNLFSCFFVSPFFFRRKCSLMTTLGLIVTGKEPEESDHFNRGLVLSDNVILTTKSSFRKW